MNQPSIIRFLATRLGIFLAALAVTYLLAAITATQSVISSLAGMGVDVNLADRVSMTLHDIGGMAGMFLPMIAMGLLVAFLVTALLCRWFGQWRSLLYPLAGAAALLTIHLALNLSFEITPVAIARTPVGLLIQALAGAAGGYTYLALSRRA